MAEPNDYMIRVATEERERRVMEDARRRSEAREDARHEQSMAFEANKHMTTLSLSALVLTVALGELSAVEVDVGLGLFAFGVPLVLSLNGMRTASLPLPSVGQKGPRPTTPALIFFVVSASLFVIGVLIVVLLASVEAR